MSGVQHNHALSGGDGVYGKGQHMTGSQVKSVHLSQHSYSGVSSQKGIASAGMQSYGSHHSSAHQPSGHQSYYHPQSSYVDVQQSDPLNDQGGYYPNYSSGYNQGMYNNSTTADNSYSGNYSGATGGQSYLMNSSNAQSYPSYSMASHQGSSDYGSNLYGPGAQAGAYDPLSVADTGRGAVAGTGAGYTGASAGFSGYSSGGYPSSGTYYNSAQGGSSYYQGGAGPASGTGLYSGMSGYSTGSVPYTGGSGMMPGGGFVNSKHHRKDIGRDNSSRRYPSRERSESRRDRKRSPDRKFPKDHRDKNMSRHRSRSRSKQRSNNGGNFRSNMNRHNYDSGRDRRESPGRRPMNHQDGRRGEGRDFHNNNNRKSGGGAGGGGSQRGRFNSDGVKRPVKGQNGDWECSECKNINFARRSECNRCKRPKPEELGPVPDNEDRRKPISTFGGPPGLFKEGDWKCPSCGNINFSKREFCNRCRLRKPVEEAENGSLNSGGVSTSNVNPGSSSNPPLGNNNGAPSKDHGITYSSNNEAAAGSYSGGGVPYSNTGSAGGYSGPAGGWDNAPPVEYNNVIPEGQYQTHSGWAVEGNNTVNKDASPGRERNPSE